MWKFLRLLLAFLIAFFLAMILGGVLLVGALTSAAIAFSQKDKSPSTFTAQEGWLYLPLFGELREYDKNLISLNIGLFGALEEKVPTLDEIRQALEKAAQSEKVKGVMLRLGNLSASPAQVQQIGRWLRQFKTRAKKPVYAYGDYFSELTYYLAAYADTIAMYPRAGTFLEWNGLVSEQIFFKRLLDKWGIKPRLFRTGGYKSAAENITEERFSQTNKEQLTELLGDIWNEWVDTIAALRKIPPESLRSWTDTYIFFSPQEALRHRLVDTLIAWDSWERTHFTPSGKKDPAWVSYKALLAEKDKAEEYIALAYMEGSIGPEEEVSAEEWLPILKKIEEDEQVKAVVLRINSPGGAVLDSDKMARAIQRLRQRKPVVVSMSGVAASGGYYLSAYANKIVAEPTTITGSIGVIALLLDLTDLAEKELYLRTDRIKVGGKYADFMSPFREPTPVEQEHMQNEIEGIYREFLEVVREGRRYPSAEAVHTIAQGRVWSGKDALSIGLVDTLGGIETAVKVAADLARLSTYGLKTYPKKSKWGLDLLLGDYLPFGRLWRQVRQGVSPSFPQGPQLLCACEIKVR
ncbi:MAG: signal peptide peptidase SppA [Bacteroidia bacterium]